MGCGSCATGSCGSVVEKSSGKSNGSACATKGCNKLNTFDWLGNMELPGGMLFDVAEVKFKGGRKEFFRNIHHLDIVTGDPVVVEAANGYHIGYVSLQGELVRLQMSKKKVPNDENIKAIYRKASDRDLEKYDQVKKRELSVMFRTREIVTSLGLKMKLSDVEFQADNTKATFYYTADDRVDFRELIKVIASEFKIRVEMRQISLRQEASRLGGIGSCGRELCCSTWLTDFKSVSTGAARYQNLSLNPAKLSGQCGRLKCCLNYELETYLDALIDIPKVEKPLQLEKGDAYLQKVDIFRKILWFSYQHETTWFSLNSAQVREIQDENRKGVKPPLDGAITALAPAPVKDVEQDAFKVVLNDDLDRLDSKNKKKSKKKRGKKKPEGGQATPKGAAPNNAATEKASQPTEKKEGQPKPARPQNQPPRPKPPMNRSAEPNMDKQPPQATSEGAAGSGAKPKPNRNRKFNKNRKGKGGPPPNKPKE